MNYDSIEIGQTKEFTKTINREDVFVFAGLTGDFNPIHISDDEARYGGKTVAHGLLTGSLFSRMFGMIFPGEGSIYISQSFNFKLPVFMGDSITIKVIVKEKLDKRKVLFDCVAVNQDGKTVVTGEAILKVKA